MPKKSAGILFYRMKKNDLQVFLVHPGGPFWKNKDEAAWSIPKGEFEEGEDPLDAAKREMKEETGIDISSKEFQHSNFSPINPVKQKSGKIVYAWIAEAYFEVTNLVSNTIEINWPPRSGKKITCPEVDKAEWFSIEEAERKILSYQLPFLTQLKEIISSR